MECDGSLTRAQESATCLCPEEDEFNIRYFKSHIVINWEIAGSVSFTAMPLCLLQVMLVDAQWRRYDDRATRVTAQEPGIHWFEQFHWYDQFRQQEASVTRFQSGREGIQEDVCSSEWGRRQAEPWEQSRWEVHRDHHTPTVHGQRVSTSTF